MQSYGLPSTDPDSPSTAQGLEHIGNGKACGGHSHVDCSGRVRVRVRVTVRDTARVRVIVRVRVRSSVRDKRRSLMLASRRVLGMREARAVSGKGRAKVLGDCCGRLLMPCLQGSSTSLRICGGASTARCGPLPSHAILTSYLYGEVCSPTLACHAN